MIIRYIDTPRRISLALFVFVGLQTSHHFAEADLAFRFYLFPFNTHLQHAVEIFVADRYTLVVLIRWGRSCLDKGMAFWWSHLKVQLTVSLWNDLIYLTSRQNIVSILRILHLLWWISWQQMARGNVVVTIASAIFIEVSHLDSALPLWHLAKLTALLYHLLCCFQIWWVIETISATELLRVTRAW